MKFTLAQIASICSGKLSTHSDCSLIVDEALTDTRSFNKSKHSILFIAIVGDNYNGHDFVDAAIASGAKAVLVNKSCGIDRPNLIYVDDTIKALGVLAQYHRGLLDIPVVGLTGSAGKTTLKEMVRAICDVTFGSEAVLATQGNLNNHIGVPLTLLRLNHEHKVAIIEMGMNHLGEINYLTHIATPTIALVANAKRAHLGNFADSSALPLVNVQDRIDAALDSIIIAKSEIYNGLIAKGGIALVNQLDDNSCERLKKILTDINKKLVLDHMDPIKIIKYGHTHDSYHIKYEDDLEDINSNKVTLAISDSEITCNLKVLGNHNREHALSAAVIASCLGCGAYDIKAGLESYLGIRGRLNVHHLHNGNYLIDDSYNANPDSVALAVSLLKNMPKTHWVLLGDILELGEFSHQIHSDLGRLIYDNDVDVLLTFGQLSRVTHEKFLQCISHNEHKKALHFDNKDELSGYIKKHITEFGVMLVKGSHGMHLDLIVEEIIAMHIGHL